MRLLTLSALLLASAALAQSAVPAATPAPAFVPLPFLSDKPVRTFTEPQWVVNPAHSYRAVLHTSKGDVTVELNARQAPKAVNSFVFLALNHFYDGTRFHRVIGGFMAQGGDPLSADAEQKTKWGTGGPGYQFFVELDPNLTFNTPGVLGMARSQSYFSQGSQFFITLAPADFLTGQYTAFGKVLEGQDILATLTRTATSGAGGEVPVKDAEADVLRSVQILVSSGR
ncbi:peptidylprolyl isomerase [Deinococcus hopiensis]|uniref:Peptidyl-prolyl cis-trans isomerase n=1 Tax=Deinococcus hopiensis KR-140 TaxID=695939 RepID=A0A1W1VH88_9DEIO|nr:peptidylprolyl isomerase [Deinococcus hopiensis]SMB92686.1 peptidylprolyl isomerase [Deinococcus hopiensis KR-140]